MVEDRLYRVDNLTAAVEGEGKGEGPLRRPNGSLTGL